MEKGLQFECPSKVGNEKSSEKMFFEYFETKTRKCHSEVFTSDDTDDNDFWKFDEKTNKNEILSNRTDESKSQSTKNKHNLSEGLSKTEEVKRVEELTDLSNEFSCNNTSKTEGKLLKSKRVFEMLSKLCPKLASKLLVHLSKTSTADKYIRLAYSILKLYRALVPKNNFSFLSKELLNTRRVIQWESKYQLAKEFMTEELSPFEAGYKTLELFGSLSDFFSFWLHCLSNGSSKIENLASTIYQWQDDCYFYQCLIELVLSTKKFFNCLEMMKKENENEEKIFNFKHHLTTLRERKENLERKINHLKTIQNENIPKESENSKCIILQTLTKQLESKEAEIHTVIKNFKISSCEYKIRIKKEVLRNSLKVMKYICDSITSCNNYSRKIIELNPTFGSVLSIISSILSLCLIWMF